MDLEQYFDVFVGWMAVVLVTLTVLLPSCCFYKKKSAQKGLEVQSLPEIEAPEPEKDAETRQEHNRKQWKPTYEVLGECVKQLSKPHPKTEPEFKPPELNPENKLRLLETVQIYLVPEIDPCRGVFEEDEQTEHGGAGSTKTSSLKSAGGSSKTAK